VSSPAPVLLWAQRVLARRNAPAHQILEIRPNASLDDAQDAFHKIARIAHPDLHRATMSAEDLEVLTTAYAMVAGAYQSYRTQAISGDSPSVPSAAAKADKPGTSPAGKSGPLKPITETAAGSSEQGKLDPEKAMSNKALPYWRKAEAAIRRGDTKSAVLQIKLAIATDPLSTFLRSALTEIEADRSK
jgi:DnaJ-class molecular chaperone